MKHPLSFVLFAVSLALVWSNAQSAAKSCDELKAEIAAKLDAKGVQHYTLEVIPTDQADERAVVGRCDAGTHKIVYSKNH